MMGQRHAIVLLSKTRCKHPVRPLYHQLFEGPNRINSMSEHIAMNRK
jgi:hypothetical protein